MALNLSKEYGLDARPFDWDSEGTIKLWISPTSTTKGWVDAMNAFSRWQQARQAGFRRGIKDSEVETERIARMKEAASKYLIHKWEGVVDEETGEPVEYTPELGLELMNDPDRGDAFFTDVLSAAGNASAFRAEAHQETAGNSAELSDTGEPSESSNPKTAAMRSVS